MATRAWQWAFGFAFLILGLAVLLGVTNAAAQDSSTENADFIRGVVINRVTREPIARALVSSSDQRLATLTDSEGRFEFTLPHTSGRENGQAVNVNRSTFLFARKPGFLAENTPRDYSSAKSLTITLVPEAVIVGRVSLPNAEAPDPILLEIFRRQVQNGLGHWVAAGSTQSRSTGEFRFADLQAGSYKVITRELLDRDPQSFDPQGQVFGYPPAYSENAPDFNSASVIQVAAGTIAIANLSVTRKAYHQIHIPVANAPDAGGLSISVFASEHREPGFSLGYNNHDHAIEGLLPDGSYTIEAFGFAGGSGAGTGSLTIAVHGMAVRGPVMTLVPSVSIRVNVNEEFTSTDNSGSSITFNTGRRSIRLKGPRSYLNVLLEPADDYGRSGMPSLREPTGTGDEALVIENARPGRYWVRVSSNRGYAASVRSGSADLLHEPLVVTTGGSPPAIEITMRDDSAAISGTVEGIRSDEARSYNAPGITGVSLSSSGVGAPPAHVYCVPTPESGGQYAEVWVSPDGTFSSPALAPGVYRVLAFDRPQTELEYRNPEAMQVYETKGPVVRIAGGQQEHVRLQLISSSE
jgi:hypothetical protein